MLSATHQKIRGIINRNKILFYMRRKVVVDINVLMSVMMSCREVLTSYQVVAGTLPTSKRKGKDVVEIFTQSGKIPLSFFTLVGKDLNKLGE